MANDNLFDLSDSTVAKVHAKKESVKAQLKSIPGVLGVGTGMKRTGGVHDPETIAIRVYVRMRKSNNMLSEHHRIPSSFTMDDGTVVVTDVLEIGSPRFYSFYGKQRPLKYGVVMGESSVVNDGTLGMIVVDNTDGKEVMLSAGHSLSNFNSAALGSAILQPGPAHGGVAADAVGALKRYIPFDMTPGAINYVDAGIASINSGITVQKKSMCSFINPSKDKAVGLLFAGSEVINIINPIQSVATALNITIPNMKAAAVGMTLKKCAAATEYTTATITDIGADIAMDDGAGNLFWFNDQILTAGGVSDAAAGDSGAIWYQG